MAGRRTTCRCRRSRASRKGINLPRYPSVPGRLRARTKEVEVVQPTPGRAGLVKLGLRVPVEQRAAVEILGRGADAAPAVVDMLERIGILDA